MSSENNIAIVIPAFKDQFLLKTLESLASQVDKRFTVYIGDDNSPYDLKSVIDNFHGRLNIVYQRFDSNLGGTDLISHWNRCLDMVQSEEWFIMFSDDDLMESNCIQNFNNLLSRGINNYDVYRFNLKIINSTDEIIELPSKFPVVLDSLSFYKLLFQRKLTARMPEFIFRTSNFKIRGGFISFEMGMRTDNATVINCAYDKSIYSINTASVLWRDSGINISVAKTDSKNLLRKFRAYVDFFNWISDFCKSKKKEEPLPILCKIDFIMCQAFLLTYKVKIKDILTVLKTSNDIKRKPYFCFITPFYSFYRKIKTIV